MAGMRVGMTVMFLIFIVSMQSYNIGILLIIFV